MAECGLDSLSSVMEADAASRLIGFIRHLQETHRQEISEPHWYLMVLGVEPSAQRRGVGSELLQWAIDQAGVKPLYLETAEWTNLPFYTAHGFANLGERSEPQSGLRFWPFLRSSR